ncbi:hypothetical protein [Nocardia sp. SC052]|uniref:hypothetical protein n=1 Tax=Nocardia sichangensis TaxID=3385975 RepID=UPI0039A250F0
MNDWPGLITAIGGAGGGLVGVIGLVVGWRSRQANYAQATAQIGAQAADIAGQVAAGLRTENAELKTDIAELDRKVDFLQESILTLKDIVLLAVYRLERHGDVDAVTEIRAKLTAINNRPVV